MTKSVTYSRGSHKIRVRIDDPRDTCLMCQKKFTGRRLNTHHHKYVYSFDEVRANKELALENTVKLCVKHHMTANDLRKILDWYIRGHYTLEGWRRLIESLPEDMRLAWRELSSVE